MTPTLGALQRRLVYFPDRAPVPAAARVLLGARDVALTTSDGLRLGAWLVPPRGPAHLPDRGVAVLVAPGNAGNRLGRAPLARALSRSGHTVLLVDYRGYGGNPGSPTQRGLAADVRAARTHLLEVEGFPPGRVVHFGESLGAAVATELSTEHPPAGLVLRSPFVDLATVGHHHYPMLPIRTMLHERYPVAELIGRITVPTVVIYGTADATIPAAQSRAVADRAGGPVRVVVVDGADHNDRVLLDGAPVVDAVDALTEPIAAA